MGNGVTVVKKRVNHADLNGYPKRVTKGDWGNQYDGGRYEQSN
jgi:hypothetical protein